MATVCRGLASVRPRTARAVPTKTPTARMHADATPTIPEPRLARPCDLRGGGRERGGGGGGLWGPSRCSPAPAAAARSSSRRAARSCRSAPDDRKTSCSLCAAAATSPALSLPRSRISLARRARVSLVSFNRVQPTLAERIAANEGLSTESAWAPTRKNNGPEHNPIRPRRARDHCCNVCLCKTCPANACHRDAANRNGTSGPFGPTCYLDGSQEHVTHRNLE